ncbi:MAG: inosine/xanthosine triphosphatase, partial [Halobacteriales archaeon]|nr:inosine/xanthosine triphosphatase [Halobacteriales archaeon]
MRVCLGGTFEPFHAGHKALLRAAADGADEIFVGVTDAALATRPDRKVTDWGARAKAVEAFLRSTGYQGGLTVRPLADPHGPAATGDYDRIVVSPETEPAALAINVARQKHGMKPLQVQIVPHVLGQDLLPISGTAIHAGRTDADGARLAPVEVAVGSANEVKVAAVRAEFTRLVPVPVQVRGFAVPTGVPEQPKDDETLQGARRRAVAARAAWPGCDYAVGIEAGLVRFPGAEGYLEAQGCVVIDRTGWETHGWGPAFHYPDWVTVRALRGEMVSDVLGPLAKDPRLGATTGAIGWLSEGRLDRVALSRMAVLMAFVPRFRRALYV